MFSRMIEFSTRGEKEQRKQHAQRHGSSEDYASRRRGEMSDDPIEGPWVRAVESIRVYEDKFYLVLLSKFMHVSNIFVSLRFLKGLSDLPTKKR